MAALAASGLAVHAWHIDLRHNAEIGFVLAGIAVLGSGVAWLNRPGPDDIETRHEERLHQEMTAEDTGDALRIDVRDWGSGKNPETQPAREFDPTTPGGLGLICLKQFMDEVKFNPQPDGMQLTMVRKKKRAG